MSHIVSDVARRPIHLNPQAELAERVLLPGDPRRALLVAQELLESPRMFNTRRGLWGYTGRAPDGGLVTVQATGMGGPSAAIVASELIGLGATTLVRIGTCGAYALELGAVAVVREAIAADGASRALGADGRVAADAALTSLVDRSLPRVVALSTDLFYDSRGPVPPEAQVVEMEAAALFALAARHGVRAACILAVTDQLAGGRVRIDDEELERLGVRLGEVALEALAAGVPAR